MEKITFDIPYPPTKKGKSAFCRRFGLNAYYEGKHWAKRRKDADELHALTLAALKQAAYGAGWYMGRSPLPLHGTTGWTLTTTPSLQKPWWTRSRDTCCPTTITAGTGRSYIGFGTGDVFGWR